MNLRSMTLRTCLAGLGFGLVISGWAAAPAAPAAPSRLDSFDKYVSQGSPKNALQIQGRLRNLSKEEIVEFDRRHQGFVNAYIIISRNNHYKIQTDWPIAEILRTATLLDGFTETFIKNLGVEKADLLQCQLRLYRSPEEFRRLVASMGLGMGIGGWFRPDQGMIVGFWNPDPLYHHETTLIHEGTHLVNFLVMRRWNNTNNMPTWLNEGMAVFFESSFMPWAHKLDLGRNAFSRLIYLKNAINNPDLPEDQRWTETKTLMNYAGMIPPQCYGESWAIIHFLCFRYGESKRKPFTEFKILWDRVCQGKATGDYQYLTAFVKERTGQTLEQFMNEVIAYTRELTLPDQYLADGKTKIEWELTLPDPPPVANPPAPAEAEVAAAGDEAAPAGAEALPKVTVAEAKPAPKPWLIKIKDPALAADQGDIALRTMSKLGSNEATAVVELAALAPEEQSFFGPGLEDKLAKLELNNQEGTISLDGDFLEFDVSDGSLPSEAKLKVADTDCFELSFRLVVAQGVSGIRVWGERGDLNSGYLLGFGEGAVMMADLAGMAKAMPEATDDAARAKVRQQFIKTKQVPFQLGQEYTIGIKIEGKSAIITCNDAVIAKMGGATAKPGVIAFQVTASSKARIADLKAKKL